MKLLICTQAVDSQDSNLGFFHRWIEEFATHCERVTVICLREGEHALPQNVRVLSLGKERGTSRIARIWHFFAYIRAYKNEYDAVFVHMNPEYVLLGGRYWHKRGKKVGLWYAHKSVTRRLRYAVKLVDRVFSVSQNSFGISTPKLCALGHGIDTELFRPAMHEESTETRIITTGRLAESKHLLEMLGVLDVLYARGEKFSFSVAGEAGTPAEAAYKAQLELEIAKRPYSDRVRLLGAVPHHEIVNLLHEHDVFFNFSTTGNMDKAGLEALAAGLPLLTTNSEFAELLGLCGLYVPTTEPEALATALLQFFARSDLPAVLATLRNRVVAEHSLTSLIPKILTELI